MTNIPKLKKAMKRYGIGSRIASQLIGCSQRQVQRWLNGDAVPSKVYQQLIELAIEKMPGL